MRSSGGAFLRNCELTWVSRLESRFKQLHQTSLGSGITVPRKFHKSVH